MDRREVHERFERIRDRAYRKVDQEWRRIVAGQPKDQAESPDMPPRRKGRRRRTR